MSLFNGISTIQMKSSPKKPSEDKHLVVVCSLISGETAAMAFHSLSCSHSFIYQGNSEMWMNWYFWFMLAWGKEMRKRRFCSFCERWLWSQGSSHMLYLVFVRVQKDRFTLASSVLHTCVVVRWVVWRPFVGTSAYRQELLLLCVHRAMAEFSEMTSLNSAVPPSWALFFHYCVTWSKWLPPTPWVFFLMGDLFLEVNH